MVQNVDFTPPTPSQSSQSLSTANSPPRARNRVKYYELLPERHNPVSGERAMWVAVITQALMDGLSKSKTPESMYFKHEAIHWLTGNSANFIMVCELAGLHPDDIRRRAKKALVCPRAWRAMAGKGKRYAERKAYRLRITKEVL